MTTTTGRHIAFVNYPAHGPVLDLAGGTVTRRRVREQAGRTAARRGPVLAADSIDARLAAS